MTRFRLVSPDEAAAEVERQRVAALVGDSFKIYRGEAAANEGDSISKRVAIPKKVGFWRIDNYPRGGCFGRCNQEQYGIVVREEGNESVVVLDSGNTIQVKTQYIETVLS